ALIGPVLLAYNANLAERLDEGIAFRPRDFHRISVGASGLLTAEAETSRAIGIFVFNGKVIVNISVLLLCAYLTSTCTRCAHWELIAERPCHHVETVYYHLHEIVARKPVAVIPIAHLIFHIGPSRLARLVPQSTSVARRRHTSHFSN